LRGVVSLTRRSRIRRHRAVVELLSHSGEDCKAYDAVRISLLAEDGRFAYALS